MMPQSHIPQYCCLSYSINEKCGTIPRFSHWILRDTIYITEINWPLIFLKKKFDFIQLLSIDDRMNFFQTFE